VGVFVADGVIVGVGVVVAAGTGVGVGVIVGVGDDVIVIVGVNAEVGVIIVDCAELTGFVAGISGIAFEVAAKTSFALSACVWEAKIEGISSTNTARTRKISPLFLEIFPSKSSLILNIKKILLFSREG
jgi:hypothetical protein